MALTQVIERDGVLAANGDRYVTVGGPGRTGLLCRVAIKGSEAWCRTCGRVQPDNECGPCEDEGCAGTNIGRASEDTPPYDEEDDLTPEDIALGKMLEDRLRQHGGER